MLKINPLCHTSSKVLKSRKIGHAPFKESCVRPVIMPNFSFKRWRRYIEIYFAISYLVIWFVLFVGFVGAEMS